MNLSNLFFDMIDVKRDIYQNATLFTQHRLSPEEYQNIYFNRSDYQNIDNVADFIKSKRIEKNDWEAQNQKFIRYHQSLNPHTFFNSIPIDHYIGQKTKLAFVQNQIVIDIGGGTGHFLSSFFRYPQSLKYFLVDPNVRLLHDQFVRMYPELLEIPIAHIRAYAEDLPFKNDLADLIVSSSAIDHYSDYKLFLKESYRCLKRGGSLLISSHLAGAKSNDSSNFGIIGFIEKAARGLHRLKNQVSLNDHVKEFPSTEELIYELNKIGYQIQEQEVFKQYFYIVARK